MESSQSLCPHCTKPITPDEFFCPSCGKQLKEKPPSTTVGRQIYMYILSILLPPWGFYPAYKYLKQDDSRSKSIGALLIFLTIISIGISVKIALGVSQKMNSEFSKQLQLYQGY